MFAIFVIVHILVSLIMILIILLQSGKAGDLSSAFGGASSQTAFGARGATTFLGKATTACAVIFMLTSLGLSILYTRDSGTSVMDSLPYGGAPGVQQEAPETEAPAPPATEGPVDPE